MFQFRGWVGLLSIGLLMLACQTQGNPSPRDIEELSDLDKVTTWFVTAGIGEYYAKGYNSKSYARPEDDPLVKRLNQEFSVYTRSVTVIDSDDVRHSLLSVSSSSGKYGASVENFVRLKTANGIYEYWVLNIGSRDNTDISFVLAQAPSMGEPRRIVSRSKLFLESYTFADGQKIDFPDSNMVIIMLLPHMYPEAFAGTKLEGKQVRVVQDNESTKIIEVEMVGSRWNEKKTDGARQLHFVDGKAIEYVYKDGQLIER